MFHRLGRAVSSHEAHRRHAPERSAVLRGYVVEQLHVIGLARCVLAVQRERQHLDRLALREREVTRRFRLLALDDLLALCEVAALARSGDVGDELHAGPHREAPLPRGGVVGVKLLQAAEHSAVALLAEKALRAAQKRLHEFKRLAQLFGRVRAFEFSGFGNERLGPVAHAFGLAHTGGKLFGRGRNRDALKGQEAASVGPHQKERRKPERGEVCGRRPLAGLLAFGRGLLAYVQQSRHVARLHRLLERCALVRGAYGPPSPAPVSAVGKHHRALASPLRVVQNRGVRSCRERDERSNARVHRNHGHVLSS